VVGDNHILNEHLASPVALSQNTHISANDIAASLLNQLKNSGLTLAPLSLPVDSAASNQRSVMSGQHTTTANKEREKKTNMKAVLIIHIIDIHNICTILSRTHNFEQNFAYTCITIWLCSFNTFIVTMVI
jgi:hypothetical protein